MRILSIKILFAICFALISTNIYSKDLLSDDLEIKEKTYITIDEIKKMGEPNCLNALDLSDKSNQLANYYSQMLEPFYNADRDDREAAFDVLRKWDAARFESQSNKLKTLRNESLVKRAECLFDEGEYNLSISAIYKALDLIDVKQTELWKRSIDVMISII